MSRNWTPADNCVLIQEHRAGTPYKQLAALLDRTVGSIRKQVQSLHQQGRLEVRWIFEPSAELEAELMRRWNAGEVTREIVEGLIAAGHEITMRGFQTWVRRARMAGLPLVFRRENRVVDLTAPWPRRKETMRLDAAEDIGRKTALMEATGRADGRFALALHGRRFEEYHIRPGVLRDYARPATELLRASTTWE